MGQGIRQKHTPGGCGFVLLVVTLVSKANPKGSELGCSPVSVTRSHAMYPLCYSVFDGTDSVEDMIRMTLVP